MNVLFIGLGSIAKKHIYALRQCEPNVNIFALRSSRTAASLEGINDFYSWEEAMKQTYDFVVISNPTSFHRETIAHLKDTQLPLFIEKPLFESLEGKELVDNLIEKNHPTYVACNLRWLKVLQNLKCIITKERVNEVNVYCGSYLPEWRPGQDFRKCYSAIPELGGGVHIDLIHEIDYVYWLFGQPQKVHKVFTNKSSLNIRAFDYANYILEYADFNVNIILNYYRRDSKRICEVVTEQNTYIANLLDGTIKNAHKKIIIECTQRISDTYYEQMSHFIDFVKKNQFTFNTIKDGYSVLKICLE